MSAKRNNKTVVGDIDADILRYSVGRDTELDIKLVEFDCLGTAAHVSMLERIPLEHKLITSDDKAAIISELVDIMRKAGEGRFSITEKDQDVHLAVERILTKKLGDLGKKVHTARSRNDQVAVDLRLFMRDELIAVVEETSILARELLNFARKHKQMPMVGRTHMQPAMPSSVGLWASAFSEDLLDDIALLRTAYKQANLSPLGSAASFGVPLDIDRKLVASLLGFSDPLHNVLHASNTRGKLESIVLSALSQTMLTVSRIAQDLILFSMPEFGYFSIPANFCTGSSIMPQKNNPDVLELIRARTAVVGSYANTVFEIVRAAPTGYNRDLQEAKFPLMDGIRITRETLAILPQMISGLKVNETKLIEAFTPDVFATDRTLELVAEGMPFRDAYNHVKAHIDDLENCDPKEAIGKKTHEGAPLGIDFVSISLRIKAELSYMRSQRRSIDRKFSNLLGVSYPLDRH